MSHYTEYDSESTTVELGELGLEMEIEYTVARVMQEDYEGDGSERGGIYLNRCDTVVSESLDTIGTVKILDHKHGKHYELKEIPDFVRAALVEVINERIPA